MASDNTVNTTGTLPLEQVETLQSINRTLLARSEPVMQGIPKLGVAPLSASMQAAMGHSLGGNVDFDDLFPKRSVDGYAEVASIQSLFSPGRYLVELYNIAKGLHGGSSPLHIDQRRPDLKALVLNEANLDKEVSTLNLLNEVLQTGMQASKGTTLKNLETTFYPMTLPYHDNLVQVRSVLSGAQTSLQQLWSALTDEQMKAFKPLSLNGTASTTNPDLVVQPKIREQLKLTPALYTLLGATAADQDSVRKYYNLPSNANLTEALKSVEVFCARTGLSFNQLMSLTAQANYSNMDLAASINKQINNLAPGSSKAVVFTFNEDPGSTFSAADIVLSNGTLGPISGTGTTRTATVTSNATNLISNGSFTGGATGWNTSGTVY
ncbi:Tc toxin subunit A, partial [Pseudomonas sp. NPDC087346]|uniref:Tc toxin subunit A n=1 Tax=Pseudomonas sp. NPDC087346 TaxID=3364438 RepID=UPI00381E815D